MKAGPELDALFAEKVMGWSNINSHTHWDESDKRVLYGHAPDGMDSKSPVPFYSTEIAHVWPVWEENSKGRHLYKDSPTEWHVVEWDRKGNSVDEIIATYPHLTHAQVHDALSYAFDHKSEIDALIEENTEAVVRSKYPDRPWLK